MLRTTIVNKNLFIGSVYIVVIQQKRWKYKIPEKLNENEHKVLKVMIKQAWSETGGEFGFTTMIKVKGLSKHQIAGYIGDLEKKGYIAIYPDFDQFMLKKKVEKVFENVKVESDYFILKK